MGKDEEDVNPRNGLIKTHWCQS